jgi:lipopolysaccharide transport system ATP-binding protein
MKTKVQFEHVYKQYSLGLTRTGLPSLVTSWVKSAFLGSSIPPENKSFWALHDINFELTEGECLALVGANGAGKTTILKLLSNITKPTSGFIKTTGQISALIELGAGFHPDLTGRENILLNGAILGLSRQFVRSRFDEIVAFSELDRFIDTPVKRYSSGMLVRLGFAVASCIKPDILLVDEVLAVGDASFQQKCLDRILGLIRDGTSIIFVSHNINMVESVCSSALYIKRGQIIYRGTAVDAIKVYERELHEERSRKLDASMMPEQKLGHSEVDITKVELLAANGQPLNGLRSHYPVEIRIHYRSLGPPIPADAVIRVVRSDGLTCCMLRTATDNVPVTLNGGEGMLSVMLEPLQLIGGSYFVNAYLSTTRDLVLLATGRSDWFYVDGATLSHEERSGVFEPNHRWLNHTNCVADKVMVG